jgi:hypothetical protein
MSDYIDLIQKEKEEALRDYREDAFRWRLDQKINENSKPSYSYERWFRKPAFAGSTVVLMIFLGWLSVRFFHPSSQAAETMQIKNTFMQLFNQHGTILSQSPLQVDTGSEKSTMYEFEWSVKRVIFAIQRENTPNEDIAQNLSRVLQNAAVLFKAEKSNSGEMNI